MKYKIDEIDISMMFCPSVCLSVSPTEVPCKGRPFSLYCNKDEEFESNIYLCLEYKMF